MRGPLNRLLLASIALLAIAPTACSDSNAVPDQLVEIEEHAEDIIDLAAASQWEDIDADVQAVREAWNRYEAPASVSPALVATLATSIDALEAASASRIADATAQAANDLSAALFDVWEGYAPSTPIAISRLDVVGRQVILDVNRADLEGARIQLELARRTFDELRSAPAVQDAEELTAKIDASFGEMSRALDAADPNTVVQQANVFLELVDDLERLY